MIRGIVFDLDGTLYCGEKAVDGALDTVFALLDSGLQVFYLTDNSGKARSQIVAKLKNIGFPAGISNTYSASHAIARYLADEKLSPVCLIGTEGLKNELSLHGIATENSPAVSAVAVGLDPHFDYCKIAASLEALDNGAKLVVANLNPWYPVENGRKLPGCGAMVGAIVGATGHKPDFIAGKPNTYMLELLCREHGLRPSEICIVGDVPESDIETAGNFGCMGILFDPKNAFETFPGRINKLPELLSYTG